MTMPAPMSAGRSATRRLPSRPPFSVLPPSEGWPGEPPPAEGTFRPVSVVELLGRGVRSEDLRDLLCRGYACHLLQAPGSDTRRSVLKPTDLEVFRPQSFLSLTALGAELLGSLSVLKGESTGRDRSDRPVWDEAAHELRVGPVVVKKFRRPAENQELVLAAFQELGWPLVIDDPLPQCREIRPRDRLIDTVKRLNRRQIHRRLLFHIQSKAQAVSWEVIDGPNLP